MLAQSIFHIKYYFVWRSKIKMPLHFAFEMSKKYFHHHTVQEILMENVLENHENHRYFYRIELKASIATSQTMHMYAYLSLLINNFILMKTLRYLLFLLYRY